MSALAIDSRVEFPVVPVRVAPARPGAARPVQRAGSLPQFSTVVPLRPAAVQSCVVPVATPEPAADRGWHWTPLAMSLGVALMSATAVLGLIAVVVAFLAIPN